MPGTWSKLITVVTGQTITASASYSQSTAPSGISAGTTKATAGDVVFGDANGLTFGSLRFWPT